MTIRNTYSSESWDKVYTAFQQINFTSYDYDVVKESLLQYLKIYHPENFNDFIESSELIALLEIFAYTTELLAYRVDTMAHENFISTAQRKQSILRLAKLVSYKASRNIPARGLVKINSIRTSEEVFDSLGNNLTNITIKWNDPNNSNWKEQFFLVINKSLTTRFGQPSKSFQIADVLMQLYTFNNDVDTFRNGVYSFNAENVSMESVPMNIDENGPFERSPDINSPFDIVYAEDGKGDGSDFTGFLMFVKQGSLSRTDYTIEEATANRRIEIDSININETDVWVYRVDDNNKILEIWQSVDTLNEQNLAFNDNTSRKKFEIETLENDRIALIFGDGNFSDAPIGKFQIWTRASINQNLIIPRNKIVDESFRFSYLNKYGQNNEFYLTFSLTAAIQNNAASETIEHVRQATPSAYYAQNRMVNGQDYNTFPLKDSTILKLKTINRTFAGQPKHVEWNDASRMYENTKLFGDDLTLALDVSTDMVETKSSSKGIIDSFIEPLLQTNALLNTLTHVMSSTEDGYGIISYPRRKFIEDNRNIYRDISGNFVNAYGSTLPSGGDGSLNEKSAIQCALDQHWFGEPQSYTTINGVRHAIIADPILNPKDDGNIYSPDVPRTIDGVNTYPPGDTGSGLQTIQQQKYFGLRFNRFLSAFGNGTINLFDGNTYYGLGDITQCPASGLDYYNHKVEVLTVEMTSDSTTFTVTSNIRGKLSNYNLAIGGLYSEQSTTSVPVDFDISDGTESFVAGDAFIIDIKFINNQFFANVRKIGPALKSNCNLTGWWELIPENIITGPTGSQLFSNGADDGPNLVQQMSFFADDVATSWVFLVVRKDSPGSGAVDSWSIYNRNMKIVAESKATKFWYNQNAQIIDSETKKVVYDKIRILRSNLDEMGKPLQKAHVYDVVGFVYDTDGIVKRNSLEILPSDTQDFSQTGTNTPDNLLQFYMFSSDAYEFFLINVSDLNNPFIVKTFGCGEYTYSSGYDTDLYDVNAYDTGVITAAPYGSFSFNNGDLISANTVDIYRIGRRKVVPSRATINPATGVFGCNNTSGLDFMWQHFSPVTHLVDPSTTNIHDAFLMTSGYFTNVSNYVKGITDIIPTPPTPLELRTSYGYLLKNKMMSDTMVLHSGKVKLLFGDKADQRFRAKFRIVKKAGATFSNERIKAEIIDVIDTYFQIENWDFGDKFYATELTSLMHQRLPTQISSVVIVPMYSVNSFGSLFTIDSGFDEILQSAATVNDVEIVDELTPSVLRQVR